MKKTIKYIFSYLVMAILPMALGAQTQTENHIVTKVYKVKSQTSLTTNDPRQVTSSIQYFDELGRAKQSVLVKGGSGSFGNNNFPYDWNAGTPTNSGFFNLNGSSGENQIVSGTTPFGDTDLLWECIPDGNGSNDGGWNTDYMNVDQTKAYRYTVWVKKTGSRTDGSTYHGPLLVDNLDGTYNSNPYFWSGDLPEIDTWYLMVGYVHPLGYTGGDIGISGVYDLQGNKVIDGFEFKWSSINTGIKSFRSYLFYANQTTTRQYFWSPVVQMIDGNEDSIGEIITTTSVVNNQEIMAKDIVTHVEYDEFGRQAKQYLPYASTNTDGRFEAFAQEDTQNYYLNNYAVDFPGITDPAQINAFSEQIFENNALQRPAEQTAPGLAWKQTDSLVANQEYSTGHTIKFNYEFNAANEVRYFPVTTTISNETYIPTLGTASYYNPNELTKIITKDENWTVSDGLNKTTEEFKDKNGQVVLKRTYASTGSAFAEAHDTYYIYDDFGNLTYVFPPKVDTSDGISTNELNELSYQYVYDYRNRLVEKKIPDKGWEYIIYDPLDRPVLTQDALQRQSNKWLFTKYDALGRVAYTGQYTSSDSRTTLQNTVGGQSAMNLYEDTFTLTANILGGEEVYYTYRSFPNTTNVEVFTINYYDTYLDVPTGLTVPTLVYDQEVTAQTQGLTTVSKVRVLDPSAATGQADWITTVTYFDQKARPIYVYSKNEYLETTDIVESKLDFTGKVSETTTTHQKVGIAKDIVTIDRFEYDHMDRLIGQTQKVNDLITERIVRNNYDDLGQLKSKLTGNGTPKGYTSVSGGISITDDIITKIGFGDSWYEGLATTGTIQADGYVEFTAETKGKFVVAGLATTNPDSFFFNREYAIYLHSTQVYIYESGSNKGSKTTYENGDIFRVERIGDRVYYKKNGEVIYTSEVPSFGTLLADVSMFHIGAKIKNLHIVDNSKGLQNVDYTYNVRGWLKKINQDTQNDNDLFDFSLKYNDPISGTALFNGNISQTSWSTASANTTSNPVSNLYTYSYDALNRITSAIDNTGNYNLSLVDYDKNGNILTLQRRGHINSSTTLFDMMDNLSYTYDSGNKLIQVDDAASKTEGFKDVAGTDYTYDVNGNMISDNNKGISNITYNHLNLPKRITFNISQGSSGQRTIEYVYDATGIKLKKYVNDFINGNGALTETSYAGNYTYEKIINNVISSQDNLQFFNHSEGYTKYENEDFDYVYQYKDHLGNVRLSYSDSNDNGSISLTNDRSFANEIIEESNYYPFGLKHKGYNNVTSSNGNALGQKNKMFQGQMLDDELDLNWYGFKYRNYDPSLARFHNIDPLAEDYSYQSPYNFAENRVIDGNELEGLEWVDAKGNKVYDPNKKNSDGTRGGYTEHATANHKRFGAAARRTKTGREQFSKLVNSTAPITTEIIPQEAPFEGRIGFLTGRTYQELLTDEDTGEVTLEKAHIRIFEGTIKKLKEAIDKYISDGKGDLLTEGNQVYGQLSMEAIIGAVIGHEIEHITPSNVNESGDKELEPNKVERKIADEELAKKNENEKK
jgi:RHS repeat-associated protein